MNFILTSPTFPGDMPGPLLLGVKMNDTSSAKKNDPLCLYGWYFKLDKVVKMTMTDGFEVFIPVLIPLSEKQLSAIRRHYISVSPSEVWA